MSKIIGSIYEILKTLFSDDKSTVYLAKHIKLEKKVVLQADNSIFSDSTALSERVIVDIKRFEKDNLPKYYDCFVEKGVLYTVSEYIVGDNLQQKMKAGELLSKKQSIDCVKKILESLKYLNSSKRNGLSKGYIHGNLNPETIIFSSDDTPFITGINIPFALGDKSFIQILPGFASPEHYGYDYSHNNSSDGDTVMESIMDSIGNSETLMEADQLTVSQQKASYTMNSSFADTIASEETVATDETIAEYYDEKTTDSAYGKQSNNRKFVSDDTIKSEETVSDKGDDYYNESYIVENLDEPSVAESKSVITIDVRSDIYSVGAILYFLLENEIPNKDALKVKRLSDAKYGKTIVDIVAKAMDPNPNRRYQTANEMLLAIDSINDNNTQLIGTLYEIVEMIGHGGGGNVYRGRHTRLDKEIVIKVDRGKLITKPDDLKREVNVLKNLRHSAIPQVYDFFVENNNVCTIMDYIKGESLDRPLKRGEKFEQPIVRKWAMQILGALEYLHTPIPDKGKKGYVHSDIKPGNIMRLPNNDVCLIDFNISLAIGEYNAVGKSVGYASPEHYGYDYSTKSKNNHSDDSSVNESSSSSGSVRKILPDVRSDIYMLGATMYHLLSGKKPNKDAYKVEPLSTKDFSKPIVDIITKAMQPNPDMRYQTASEMYIALRDIRLHDPRYTQLLKKRNVSMIICSSLLVIGLLTTIIGLKRIQITDSSQKNAEYSKTALKDGKINEAIQYALEGLPDTNVIFNPNYLPESQTALANALGVYDLSDTYKSHGVITLPSSPFNLELSPNGEIMASVVPGETKLYSTVDMKELTTLPTENTSIAELCFIDNNELLYAGADGLAIYDIDKEKNVWESVKATEICISADKTTIAVIYKDEEIANIIDTKSGNVINTVDFSGRKHRMPVNENYLSYDDNLFALNNDGSFLATSFDDGTVALYDLTNGYEYTIMEGTDYIHFEGGFSGSFLILSASKGSDSIIEIVDTISMKYDVPFKSDKGVFSVITKDTGIYLKHDNRLEELIPVSLESASYEEIGLVDTKLTIHSYDIGEKHIAIAANDSVEIYDVNKAKIAEFDNEGANDFCKISNETIIIGSMGSPDVQVLKYEEFSGADFLKYKTDFAHDESRITADRKAIMQYQYNQFRILDMSANVITEAEIPQRPGIRVYDEEFIRDGNKSTLEVTYLDGLTLIYDGNTGEKIKEEQREAHDDSLDLEFFTSKYRIDSPNKKVPVVYDKKTGKKIAELSADDDLTYVTEYNDYIITQYVVKSDNYKYALLLNQKCEVIAELPYFTDIIDGELIFDYPTGDLRSTHIYDIEDLKELAEKRLEEYE